MESGLRTINNLLERLHASFFFYILTSPDEFIVIGKYLTSAVLIGVGLELNGLHGWVASGWQSEATNFASQKRVQRPILSVMAIVIITHLFGAISGALMTIDGMKRIFEVRSLVSNASESNRWVTVPELVETRLRRWSDLDIAYSFRAHV